MSAVQEPAVREEAVVELAPVRESYLVFGSPDVHEEEIEEVVATLRSGWIGTGPKVAAFQQAFAEYTRAAHAVALNSCTAGLFLSLLALGLRRRDEVIVPAMTFAATANAVVRAGGRPVLADVDPDTMCLDVEDAAAKVTRRTRAIVPVHFAGRPCAMNGVRELARAYGLFVLEDCAHASGTLYHGRHAGTIGDAGSFSFYVSKNVCTAEGGMLTTNDPELAERVRRFSLHGLSADAWKRFGGDGRPTYEVVEPGLKCNMTDIQASLGLHQLRRLEEGLVRRREIWERYDAELAGLPIRTPAPEEPGTRHARHIYTPLLELEALRGDRDEIREALHRQNIGTGVHYQAVHLHDYYRRTLGLRPGSLPVSERISERTLTLPLSTAMTDADVDAVVLAVRRTLDAYRR